MRVRVYYHDDFKLHSPDPYSHPENPDRLERALDGLSRGLEGVVEFREPAEGDPGVYTAVHSPSYLKSVLSMGVYGVEWIDADTYISPGTPKAVKRLAGAVKDAIGDALKGSTALILGRPPGHHAGIAGRALGAPTNGFCIVNTAALAAKILYREAGEPVLMVDFDLHHGNGTQEIFWDDPNVIHVDIHQDPATIYPGVGFPEDIGSGDGRGSKINIVTPAYSGDDIYLHALSIVEDILEEVKPQYIVVSAGFDAYRGDNDFTVMNVGSRFYWEAGKLIAEKARGIVAVLEGGYGLGLERGLPAFVAGLAGVEDPLGDREFASSGYAWKFYRRALERLEKALESAGSTLAEAVKKALEGF